MQTIWVRERATRVATNFAGGRNELWEQEGDYLVLYKPWCCLEHYFGVLEYMHIYVLFLFCNNTPSYCLSWLKGNNYFKSLS